MSSVNIGRQPFLTALVPNNWVVVMQDQEGYSTSRDWHHHFNLVVENDAASEHEVILVRQESDDGENWHLAYVHPETVRPGGRVNFSATHGRVKARLLAFSEGGGEIRTFLLQDEKQASPDYLQNVPLACSAYREVVEEYYGT